MTAAMLFHCTLHGQYITSTTKQTLRIRYAFKIVIVMFISFLLTILNKLNIAHEISDAQTREICSTRIVYN